MYFYQIKNALVFNIYSNALIIRIRIGEKIFNRVNPAHSACIVSVQ